MRIEPVTSYILHTRQGEVSIRGADSIELEAALAYARVMCVQGRTVQGIKFLRKELGLQLREAKHIADDLHGIVTYDTDIAGFSPLQFQQEVNR